MNSKMTGLIVASVISSSSIASEIVVSPDIWEPMEKQVWEEIIDAFNTSNPGLNASLHIVEHHTYSTKVDEWLSGSGPDVIYMHSGNRYTELVNDGKLADISDIWDDQDLHTKMPMMSEALTVGGHQYGVPVTIGPVGLFYRADIFAEKGIAPPRTWDDLLTAAQSLRAEGIIPFTIGNKAAWTSAIWLDLLTLRLHGKDFLSELSAGSIPFTDPRAREVFGHLAALIEAGFFNSDRDQLDWPDSLDYLFEGRAAMTLLGSFIMRDMPEEMLNKLDLIAFPVIQDGANRSELLVDVTLMIPARAQNSENARRFLSYLASPKAQTLYNVKLAQTPPNSDAETSSHPFAVASANILDEASDFTRTSTLAAKTPLALALVKACQALMNNPEKLDQILSDLEQARVGQKPES